MTAPKHFLARKSIRETWARFVAGDLAGRVHHPETFVQVRFFVGNQTDPAVEAQLGQEPDVVRLAGFEDSYENLSKKTLAIVGWAKDTGFDTVLKVDDDTFLRVDKLLDFLAQFPSTRSVYSGHFQSHGIVIDNPASKWYMRDQFDAEIFPTYAFGPCYFLGQDLVDYIAAHRDALFPYRVEDAGVAIWTAPVQKEEAEMPSFLYNAECADVSPDAVFVSPVNEHEMYRVLENVLGGDVCGMDRAHPFVLEECAKFRCRCWPPDGSSCYSDFANDEYKDVIPRL